MIGMCTREYNEIFSDDQGKAGEQKMELRVQFFVKSRLQTCQTKSIVWTVILEWKQTLRLPILIFFFLLKEDKYRDKQTSKGSKEKDIREFLLFIRAEIWKIIQIRYWRNSGDGEFGKKAHRTA